MITAEMLEEAKVNCEEELEKLRDRLRTEPELSETDIAEIIGEIEGFKDEIRHLNRQILLDEYPPIPEWAMVDAYITAQGV
jgi:hypothetical protein